MNKSQKIEIQQVQQVQQCQNNEDYVQKTKNRSKGRKKTFDTGSKKFFSDIKAQLKSIRTDVNKLVQKDKQSNDIDVSQEKYKKVVKTEEKRIKSIKIKERQKQKQLFKDENKISTQEQQKSSKWQIYKQGFSQKINILQLQLKKTKKSKEFYQQKQLQWQVQVNQLKSCINGYEKKLQNTNNDLFNEKQKNRLLQIQLTKNKYNNNKNQSDNFKELGYTFERKINQALNQNQMLKNKIAQLQGQRQEQQIKIKSMCQAIQIFQNRQNERLDTVNEEQLNNLRKRIINLQTQKDRLQSDHEYQIMKLQNQIDEIKSGNRKGNQNSSLNEIIKDQLTQIEYLRQKLRQK